MHFMDEPWLNSAREQLLEFFNINVDIRIKRGYYTNNKLKTKSRLVE